MKNRRCILAIGCLLSVGILVWLGSVPPAAAQQENGETAMHTSPLAKRENPTIPAIDRSQPSAFETASFGLG